MSQPEIDIIKQAQDYIRSKQLPKAQRLLVEYIKKNPNSEQAWYVLSTAVDDPRKQIECLQRVLRINPANTEAQTRLMTAMAASTAAAPVVEEKTEPAESGHPPIAPAPAPSSFAPPPVAEKPLAASDKGQPPSETGAAKAAPKPVAPEPAPIAPPSAETAADTELSSLRSRIKAPKVKRPRKRGPRIVILLLLIVAVGAYFLLGRNQNAGTAQQPESTAIGSVTTTPTATATPTVTPTSTSTPSVTPTRFPATWTLTPPPTPLPTRTPTLLPPLDSETEATLKTVQEQVADLRNLSLLANVPTRLLPTDNAEAVLRAVVNSASLQPELQNQSRTLALLGLVRPAYDLTRYTLNSFADSDGFYIPWHKTLYVLGARLTAQTRRAYAGELEQALIDQHFHSDEWGWSPLCQLTEQRCQTLRALLKGSALLTADQWVEQAASQADRQALNGNPPPASALPDDSAPLFVTRDLAFPAEQGLAFVKELYDQGGWQSVDEVLKSPPHSTEQLLDMQKYIAGERPIELADVPLTGTLGSGWQSIANNTLGEWRTYLLLSSGVDETARLSEDTARQAAKGWGGDRYQVYVNNLLDQNALAAEWAWDTPQDAAEFKQALSTYLDLRFRGAKDPKFDNCWTASRQLTCVFSNEHGTLWLLAPTRTLLDQVRQQFAAYQ